MSLAITHFAIGAGAMLLLQPLLFPNVRYRRTLVVASGLWALVPDLFYVVPGLGDVFSRPGLAPLGNVFWSHTYLDGLVLGRGTRSNAALALGFLAASAVIGDLFSPADRETSRATTRATSRATDHTADPGADEVVDGEPAGATDVDGGPTEATDVDDGDLAGTTDVGSGASAAEPDGPPRQ